jgi:hypothetical protein
MGRIADTAALHPHDHLTQQGPRCWAEVYCETDEDRDELAELMSSIRTVPEIVTILTSIGWTVSDNQVQYHRRGKCRCGSNR